MQPRKLGALIAAAFGLIYVLVNAGALPSPVAVSLRSLGGLGFVAVLVAVFRSRTTPEEGPPIAGGGFGRIYWVVVAAEVAALAAGLGVINGPLDAPQAGVAWVSLVVGLHFFALGVVFGRKFLHWLAAGIAACGAAGLVLASTGAGQAPIAAVSGVVPGALLLAAGFWGASRAPQQETRRHAG